MRSVETRPIHKNSHLWQKRICTRMSWLFRQFEKGIFFAFTGHMVFVKSHDHYSLFKDGQNMYMY